MVKQQQMHWTPRGAHLLRQVRAQVLNDELRKTFQRWYPAMTGWNRHGGEAGGINGYDDTR